MGLQRPGQARITAGAGLSGGRISHHDQRWVTTQWIRTISEMGWRTPGRGWRHHPAVPSQGQRASGPAGRGAEGCCNGTMKFLNNR